MRTICSTRQGVSFEHVDCDEERGAGAAADALCRGTEQPRWDAPPIKMISVWVGGFIGLVMLCFGMLLGASWTVQALDQRCRRLAAERRELNEWRLALREASRRGARYGNLNAPSVTKSSDGSGPTTPTTYGDNSQAETSRAGARH